MSMRYVSFIQAAVVVMCAGCSGSNLSGDLFNQNGVGSTTNTVDKPIDQSTASTDLIPGLPKGFQCPFIPNGFDPVGSIYRLDKTGTYYRVADLSDEPAVAKGIKDNVKIGDYQFNDTQKASAALSVSFLKSILPGVSGTANANQEFLIDITVRNMHAKVLYDREADYIHAWFKEKHKPKAGNRYFLVREAIFAGSVKYKLDAKDVRQAGITANIDHAVNAAANATFADNGKVLLIEKTFQPPTQVCIKVAEIEIGRSGSARVVAAAPLRSTDDAELPTIKRIGTQ